MDDNDRPRFAKVLAALGETFNREVTPMLASVYYEVLKAWPIETVETAGFGLLKSCKFFPKPAEFVEFVEGSQEDQASLAWVRVQEALSSVGTYQSVDFKDTAIHGAITAMGGWHMAWKWERMDDKQLSFERSEFLRLYHAYRRGDRSAPAVLQGQHAMANVDRGGWTRGLGGGNTEVVAIGPAGTPAPQKALDT